MLVRLGDPREVRDSERQAGHDLSLIGPKTDVRMRHEQVGGCKLLDSPGVVEGGVS